MATVRISQLTAITTPTDDDILIINDADTNTRKITYANLTQGLLNTGSLAQTKTGGLTVQGTLTAAGDFVVDTNTLYVDSLNNFVGVRTTDPAVPFDINGAARIRNANFLQFADGTNSNAVALKGAATIASDFTLTLPSALPTVTSFLTVDSSGTMEYSSGISYDSSTSSLNLGALHLTDQGYARFYEDSTNGTEYVQFRAPAALATNNEYTLPSAFPAASGYVLSSDTSGTLSWVTNSAGAAGAGSQIQYNDGTGLLAASSAFTFQPGTATMSVTNATVTGTLSATGDVNLGDAGSDTVTVAGIFDSNLVPDGTSRSLGTATVSWGAAYVDNLHVTASVDTDLIPAAGTETLGSATNLWAEVHGGVFNTGGITLQTVDSQSAVASSGSFDSTLGAVADYGSFKISIHAKDDTTGDTEFYEYFVTHDGSSVSEVTGSNVQSTPGTFLTTPAASISSGNVILTITNSALSGNTVSVKLQTTAFAM